MLSGVYSAPMSTTMAKSHTVYFNLMLLLSGKNFVDVKREVRPLLSGLGGVFYCSGAEQCFSNWVPQRGVRGFERRKCVMAILNLYVRIKIRVATFDINHSVTDSTQSISASIQQLPDL